jgi:hypothetical protein
MNTLLAHMEAIADVESDRLLRRSRRATRLKFTSHVHARLWRGQESSRRFNILPSPYHRLIYDLKNRESYLNFSIGATFIFENPG